MRAVVEADLSTTARRVVRLAEVEHWSVVGVVSTDTETGETVLSLRGRRGGCRFVVLFVAGAVEASWWLTRARRTVVAGYRRQDVWVKTKYAGRVWYPGTAVEVLEPKLKRDAELDEVIEWSDEQATFVRASSLSVLLGVKSRDTPGLLEVGTLDSLVS